LTRVVGVLKRFFRAASSKQDVASTIQL
jgi:hypothetical protein